MAKDCCPVENEEDKKHVHVEGEDHDHDHGDSFSFKTYIPSIISFVLLMSGLALDNLLKPEFFENEIVRLIWYSLAYLPVGISVFKEAIGGIAKGDFFTEFTLMTVATIGAFILGEYPEGVAVMLFYAVGELFQNAAVSRAKSNIKALLDVRPETATVKRNGNWEVVEPEQVEVGEIIQLKVGERAPLDGVLQSDSSNFNTVALTGESTPQTIKFGESVLAGMVNLDNVIEIITTKKFEDSSLAKILEMVQEASSRKAKTELLIRRFAKIYTPAVFLAAVLLVVVPYFFVENYDLNIWVYRALVFLVIACPCALVISIPLGYFGGIGAASKNGILFKGGNFLDTMEKLNTVVMDKTGTLTKGVFKVQKVETIGYDEKEFLNYVSALEIKSTHPIAKAIVEFQKPEWEASDINEISGHGMTGTVNSYPVLVGNAKLMNKFDVNYPNEIEQIVESTVIVAIQGKFAGFITIADQIKEDANKAIIDMKKLGVTRTVMLSGDKDSIVQKVAKQLSIDEAYGNLLPENKVEKLQELRNDPKNIIAFVGDGINDAPVIALSDVGIAMGGMGSDAAIETADVVIQNDSPAKIPTAIKIGRETKKIVIQNISLAFGVKLIVLVLGAGGLATMWEAVFADVGVALLAILNAIRIQNMKF